MHGYVARVGTTIGQPQFLSFSRTRNWEYLKSLTASLHDLSSAIDHEAETSQHDIPFWTTMQELVSTLRSNETEQ